MMIRTILAAAAIVLAPLAAQAAGSAKELKHAEWSWEGPFGHYDRAAMQRGFQVYKEVCSSCHGLKLLSYRNLGEPGGPFQAVASKKWQDRGETPELGPPGHGRYTVNPIDNPYVKAIAAGYTVTEVDSETGDDVERPARPADRFVYPYRNEAQGRAANGGAYPPDLSVIIKARHHGPNYLYSLLTGYGEEPPPGTEEVAGKTWNPYFKGGWIAMPDQLIEDRVTYTDGTKATREQMAKDVVTFLTWAADPKLEARKSMGFQVMAYLVLLTVLLYLAYRQVWRNESH
jgi:cytochrome c1